MIFEKINQLFSQLKYSLSQLTAEQYGQSIAILENASIGQHTRHIIEHFQALIESQETKIINYDNRKRDIEIETSLPFCIETIQQILAELSAENFELSLVQHYSSQSPSPTIINSTYYRELMFNIDHFIHHQALIKIGLKQMLPNIILDENFGYADATIKYKNDVHAQLFAQ